MSLNLSRARTLFHRDLIGSKTLSVDSAGIASNADKSQKLSCELALGIARALGTPQGGRETERAEFRTELRGGREYFPP